MSDSNWDALMFKPNRRIKLIGSGVFGPVGNPCTTPHGWKLEFQIVINGDKSDSFIFTSSDETW